MQLCMTGRLKSICKFEKKQVADTSVKKKTMQSSELESGLPDEAEQECIVFFLRVGCRELNSNLLLNNLYLKIIKINRIYKIILIKSSFIMSFKISNRGVEPDWFA